MQLEFNAQIYEGRDGHATCTLINGDGRGFNEFNIEADNCLGNKCWSEDNIIYMILDMTCSFYNRRFDKELITEQIQLFFKQATGTDFEIKINSIGYW